MKNFEKSFSKVKVNSNNFKENNEVGIILVVDALILAQINNGNDEVESIAKSLRFEQDFFVKNLDRNIFNVVDNKVSLY